MDVNTFSQLDEIHLRVTNLVIAGVFLEGGRVGRDQAVHWE
jgi:hypothetical protein